MIRKWLCKWVFFLWVLSACTTSSTTEPNQIQSTSDSSSTSILLSGTATPSLTPPPTEIPPSPTFTAEPNAPFLVPLRAGTALTIQSIEMFDGNNGWAVGGVADEDVHILQTADGGNTWRDVTPPGIPVGANFPKSAVGDFTHFQRGWVRYLDSMNVWNTADGGLTWVPARLDEEFNAQIPAVYPMQFINDQIGWVLLYAGSGMSHDFSFLYATSDGGQTWQSLVTPYDDGGYLQSCCKTGMVFYDSDVGIITYEQGPYEHPYLDWTVDGGATWESWILQPPNDDMDLPFSHYCATHSAHIFSPVEVTLGLSCQGNEDAEAQLSYLVRTSDWGSNWEYLPSPLGQFLFIDSQTGWALGPDLFSTSDGGRSWNHLKSIDWEGQFIFIDLLNGWGVDGDGSLHRTFDGGMTWSQLDPRIDNRE